MKSQLLKHLSGENIGRFPVWMMRQAGRYLPEYRAIRAKHSFWEMVTTPALAAEVSLLPLKELSVDAIIFFSDILTLPYGLGIPVEMKESIGPVITDPLRSAERFEVFSSFSPEKHTPFVGEALRMIRKATPPEKALLGFAGAPWTVACYLVEGKSSRQFEHVKRWMVRDEKSLVGSLDTLATATIEYLKFQHSSGTEMVQLFDTWLNEMPRDFFRRSYVPMLNRIFGALRKEQIPSIFYCKGAHHLDEDLGLLEVDVLSCDNLLTLSEMDQRTGRRYSLQGNLDPVLLKVADAGTVRKHTRALVQEARALAKPAILNLGHGILPETPVENAKAFIDEAIALWI